MRRSLQGMRGPKRPSPRRPARAMGGAVSPSSPGPMTEPNPVARRRTFAIISHPDAGKTTLTEKILLFGGAIQLAGEVRAKANRRQTRSDWMGIERERGISVVTSVMTFEYADCVFNLLDTPGHEDFSEDTYRTLTAVDSAVMVIDAAKGIEARTRKLFEVCRLRDIPIVTFINKMDRETRDPFDLLDEIEKTLALDTAPLDWTIGRGRSLAGAYDIRRKTLRALGKDAADVPVSGPDDPRDRRAAARARARRRDRGDDARGRGLPPVRQAGVPRGASDAGAVRQRAEGIRRARPHRRDGRIRAAAARAGSLDPHGEGGRAEDDRLRLQDPGQHGPQPSRPHRLHARLLGQADARHARQAGAHRQVDHAVGAAVLLRPGSLARRGSLRRRRRRHSQPRPAAHRRHADRGRGDRVPRRAELRAGNPAPRQARRRDEGQEAARGVAADGRRRRGAGVPAARRRQRHRRRRRRAAARRADRAAQRRIRPARLVRAEPLRSLPLGQLRRSRRTRQVRRRLSLLDGRRPRRRAGVHGDSARSTCATSRSAGRRSRSPT